MLAKINSSAVNGLSAYRLVVEVDVGIGLSSFDIVGLPDASVRESKERVRAAIKNSGFEFPLRRITVNLAPADIKKEGPSLDLPIALGILAATGQIEDNDLLQGGAFVGELSLDGTVRQIIGVLSIADLLGGERDIKRLFVPAENAAEAGIVRGVEAFAVTDLRALSEILSGDREASPVQTDIEKIFAEDRSSPALDMSDVKGQWAVKRALEIAAAGGHNILMIGSPGSGKTMLARRLPTIIPELTLAESIEVTKIYSICGMLPPGRALLTERPFRAPHHSASVASLTGGGTVPRPGEISLAHHGILFLDEMPEFHRDALEALRQPLEDRVLTVSRVHGHMDFPAGFQLVGAMNPCPCGYYGDSLKECACTPHQRHRYFAKLSGPLLDRIDMHIEVPRVQYKELSGAGAAEETSAQIKQRVLAAREIQSRRFAAGHTLVNAQMTRRELEKYCRLDALAARLMSEAFQRLKMSSRAHDRILKAARTIADLAASEMIGAEHIAEAIQYRSLDRDDY